jgi:mono/diheme cytochrome c family protein
MKQIKIMTLFVVVLAAACSGGSSSTTIAPKDSAAAKALYGQKCLLCHGANGEGGVGPGFKTAKPMSRSVEELATQITNGGSGMPGLKDTLSQEQISELAKYVYKDLQGR